MQTRMGSTYSVTQGDQEVSVVTLDVDASPYFEKAIEDALTGQQYRETGGE